jgi:protein-disulfide isomerase
MILSRRALLAAPTLAVATPLFSGPARADTKLSERFIGDAAAKVTVVEFFSLTCPHCAAFSRDSLPQIRDQLVTPGKLRYVFRDFPLDQVALTAAMVARSLPPERYEPFVSALLASQARWAFARGVNTTEELAKMAGLAGLSRKAFDTAIADADLRKAILADQEDAEKTLQVDSTPTFIFNGPNAKNRRAPGELSFAEFAKIVSEAAGT